MPSQHHLFLIHLFGPRHIQPPSGRFRLLSVMTNDNDVLERKHLVEFHLFCLHGNMNNKPNKLYGSGVTSNLWAEEHCSSSSYPKPIWTFLKLLKGFFLLNR
jgi:hypothetical protein